MKCTAANCNHTAKEKALKLWGTQSLIGFCDEHCPDWLRKLKPGELSEPSLVMGMKKSWYKKV